MNKIKAALVAATMIADVAVSGAANATVSFSFTSGASVSSTAQMIQNFNGTTITGLSGTGYTLHAGSPNDGTGAAPNASGTQYLAVLAGGMATYTLTSAVQALQFDWGTPSSDNVLTVFTSDNPTGANQTFTVSNSAFPDGTNYNKNGLAVVSASAGTTITGLKFTSGNNSFEVDNIAAVPEPASWAMMVLGFGLIGAAARSRRTAVTFA